MERLWNEIIGGNSYHGHCHCFPKASGHCILLRNSKMEKFRNRFAILKCTTENCAQIVFPWVVQRQSKMIVRRYSHPVGKVSLYIQPIEYITFIMFWCGKYCLIPKQALYLVRLEIQRKTSQTIFIFLFVGVKSALRKYLSCSPHFCHILVSQSPCTTSQREEWLLCLTLEKCSLPPICRSRG